MAATVLYYFSDGATAITADQLPDIVAGINDTPTKFGIENTGTRQLGLPPNNNLQLEIDQVGTNDGASELQLVADSATLSRPYNFAATVIAGGGVWGSTGTYGWRITAFNSIGETIGSVEVTAIVSALTQSVTLSWTTIAGATGYKIYRTSTPGTYTSPALVTTIGSGATSTFTDPGGALSAGAPPSDNRTAGWLTTLTLSGSGAGGVWGATGNYFYRVTALDSTGAILGASLEASVNVNDTTKTVTVSWVAVPGAASYTVWRATSSGAYTPTALRASGIVGTSYTDTGGATTTGTLSTAPSYGIPPASSSFAPTPIAEGLVAIGLQLFFWVRRVVPGSTPELGDPRVALITARET